MRWLRGYIECQVERGHWERFMNLCRHHNIKLWSVRADEKRVTFCMFCKDYKMLWKFVEKTSVVPHIKKKKGLPFVCVHAMRDWTFTLGLVLFFTALRVLSMFVWQINYYGQQEYTKETIRKEVTAMGVYRGMLRKNLDCDSIERNLRERYENMSWVSAEEKGCVLNIKMKEGTAEKKAAEEDTKPCHVVAPYSGRIASIVTKEGTAKVKKGRKVKKGDILIRGIVEIKDDSDAVVKKKGVHAAGEITIVTEKKYTDRINITHVNKNKTGKDIKIYTVQCNGTRFSIKNPLKWFDNSSNYDIISNICVDEEFIPLQAGLKVTEKTYVAYEQQEAAYTEAEAKEILQKKVSSRMKTYEEKGYQILDHTFEISREGSEFVGSGKIVMAVSEMKQKDVAEEELMLEQSGKDEEK